jgi:hypothetical protein
MQPSGLRLKSLGLFFGGDKIVGRDFGWLVGRGASLFHELLVACCLSSGL